MRTLARWRPAAFEPVDTVISTWFLAVAAAIRGADYMRTPQETSPSLALIEQTWPLEIWGIWFLTGALVLAVGLISERHFIVWLGHTVLGIAYLVLALGLIAPMLTIGVGLLLVIAAAVLGVLVFVGRHLMRSTHPRIWRILGRLAIAAAFAATLFMPPGLRTGVQTSYICGGHFLLWLRTGASPLKRSDSETVGTVQGER